MRDAILHAAQSGKLIDLKTAMELKERRPDIANERIDDVIAYFKTHSKDAEGRLALACTRARRKRPEDPSTRRHPSPRVAAAHSLTHSAA